MLPTPFDDSGAIVWHDIDRLVEFELEHGVHGIATLGLGGESNHLDESERCAVAERVVAAVNGRVPVIIGATAQETGLACRLAAHARDQGAEIVMVGPPSIRGIERDTLFRHYLAVAEAAAPSAIMVQDAPTYLNVELDAAFVCELAAAMPNVRFAKTEAVPAGERTGELVSLGSHSGLIVFGGNAALYYLDVLDAGALGLIPGSECPAELVAVMAAHRSGDRARAQRLFERLLPLFVFEIQTLNFFIACSKEILRHRGVLSSAALRTPSPLGAWSRAALTRHMEETLGLRS